ncbi:DMT family transporter [Elongatibacter sediminis]|uniref:DMT family transporter n=1 Tax=Elongatibacter sediminis TaxID=3119006 RepID=A0AAW9RHC7_9GAMM
MCPVESSEASAGKISYRIAIGAVLVMFLWAVCFPLINVGLRNSPPMAFAGLRASLSGLVLIAVAQWLKRPAIPDRSAWGGLAVVGFTATSLGFYGMFYGGGRVSPGLATVIANTQPLIASALAWVFLQERLSTFQRWGLVAGFGGIVLIGAPNLSGADSQIQGIAFILVAAIGIAVSNVMLKSLAGRVDVLRAMGWQLLIGALPLAILAFAIEDVSAVNWSTGFIINLLALSVLGTSMAFALWFALLDRATLSQLNAYTFLTPIFGLFMGVIFFAESLHALELAGIGLSLLGIYAVNRRSRVKS